MSNMPAPRRRAAAPLAGPRRTIWRLGGRPADRSRTPIWISCVGPVPATVAEGMWSMAFTAVVDNAKLSAIDVHPSAGGSNQPPTVSVGADKTITLPTNTVTLSGTASDDGLPSATLTVAWTKVSGPGTVTFGTPTAVTTTATFGSAGSYVLRLTANDTALTASDDVTVTVNTAAAGSAGRTGAV